MRATDAPRPQDEEEAEFLALLATEKVKSVEASLFAWASRCIADRPAFLQHLRDCGVSDLKARQKIANWLGRRPAAAARGFLIPNCPTHGDLSGGWLVVNAESGLCNKLRAVLSYRLAAHVLRRRLLVLWSMGGICDATFDECFEPLPGVSFVSYRSRIEGGDGSELELECSKLRAALSVGRDALPEEELPPTAAEALQCLSQQAWDTYYPYKCTDVEWRMYEALRPRAALREAIDERVRQCGRPQQFAALHVRRTDFRGLFGDTQNSSDADFDAFVDALPPQQRVFVATDNASTQQRLASRLGDRLCALTPLDAQARRPTSVAAAVVDLYTCAAATGPFKGTRWSSFSDTVSHLRRCQGRVHADDEHTVDSMGIPNAERSKSVLHDLAPPRRRHLGVFFP